MPNQSDPSLAETSEAAKANPYQAPADVEGDVKPQLKRTNVSYPIGVLLSLLAAFGYTLSNIALRYVSDIDPIWVTTMKAVPTILGMGPFVLLIKMRHEPLVPQRGTFWPLIVGVFIGQVFGNCSFQIALGYIGLALSVPICLGTMVIGGAISGWIFLSETISTRTIFAICVLLTAATILSLGGQESALPNVDAWGVGFGASAAALSGVAYAFFGTMVRRSLLQGMAVPTPMFISGLVGTFALLVPTLYRIGVDGILSTTQDQWIAMVAAGLFNLIAFFMLTVSLKAVSVVIVNLLNAAQVAMAAIAGVYLFAEKFTQPMLVGIAMTIVGLIILSKKDKQKTNDSARASD